jgi:hypothetical protein
MDDSNYMAGQPSTDLNLVFSSMLAEMEVIARGTKPYFRLSVIAYGSTASILVECKGEREVDVTKLADFVGSRGSSAADVGLRAAINVLKRHPGKETDFRPYVFFCSAGHVDRVDAAIAVSSELKSLDIPAGKPTVIAVALGNTNEVVMKQIASNEELFVRVATSSDLVKFIPLIGTVAGSGSTTEAQTERSKSDDTYDPPIPETFCGPPEESGNTVSHARDHGVAGHSRGHGTGDNREGLIPGTLLGELRIEQEMHRSDISISYRATDELNGAHYVVREFFPQRLAQRSKDGRGLTWRELRWFGPQRRRFRDLRRAFLNELALRSLVQHKSIALAFSKRTANRTVYTIRHDGRGVSLQEARGRRSGAFGTAQLAATYRHLLSVLAFLHSRRIVHANINPISITVLEGRYPIIGDFESAMSFSDTAVVVGANRMEFAPPELAHANEKAAAGQLGPWCDLYALAATMYFCFSGQAPKVEDLQVHIEELINKYKVPWRLASAIGVCLNSDVKRRPSAAEEVLRLFHIDEFGASAREEPVVLEPISSAIINL